MAQLAIDSDSVIFFFFNHLKKSYFGVFIVPTINLYALPWSVPSTPKGQSSRLLELVAATPGSRSSTSSRRSPRHVLKKFKGKDGKEQMILVSRTNHHLDQYQFINTLMAGIRSLQIPNSSPFLISYFLTFIHYCFWLQVLVKILYCCQVMLFLPDDNPWCIWQDFGQKLIGAVHCEICGMTYTHGEPTDEATHAKFHQRLLNVLRFPVCLLEYWPGLALI